MGGVLGGTTGPDNGCLNGGLGLTMIGENGENIAESANFNIYSVVDEAISKAHHQWEVSANNWLDSLGTIGC